MTYQGDYAVASPVVFNFNTISFTDGSPITLAGTPALSIYKNSTTESTAGITLTVDYDGRTSLHHVEIDTSADGTFYAAGNDFDVIITAGTVGGTSVVGRKVGSFSLENRSALRPETAGQTLVVDTSGVADANMVSVGPTGAGEAQTARDLGLALPAAAPQAPGGLVISTAGSLDIDDMAADVDATETRVVLAIPAAAPNAAGGLLITAAGSLDMDDLAADVDATETAAAAIQAFLTSPLTEAYAAAGGAPTLSELLFQMWSAIAQFGIVGVTLTANKIDGSTPAMTFTLDDAINPTSRVRAT